MRYLYLQHNNPFKYCYKIADSYYQSDRKINGLEYLIQAHYQFNNTQNLIHKTSKSNPLDSNTSSYKTTYQHLTPIGENKYPLQVMTHKNGQYKVKIKSDVYLIEKNTITAYISKIDISVLMGPVFILQLAKNKVFCLHASAFIMAETCFMLMADSGTGKSTIARHIQENQIGVRIADDIVPLKIINNDICLLPNFPQLKLTQEQQYYGDDICQKTVLIFAQKSNNNTTLTKIDNFIAIKKLIKHSVASKLFADIELQNHLKFCHKISEKTQSFQLDYQHNENSLNVLQDILDDMA